jgi:hypothetical protein
VGGAYGLRGACMVFVVGKWEGLSVHGAVHGAVHGG